MYFFHNDVIVGEVLKDNSEKGYNVSIFKKKKLLYEIFMKYYPKCVYSEKNFLFLFIRNDPRKEQVLSFHFNANQPEPIYLPLKGHREYTVENCLYFAYYDKKYVYYPYPDDIFRVKISDWLNPELVFEGSVYDQWFLYPESHVIGTDIALDMLDREDHRESEILYNIDTKSYDIIPNTSRVLFVTMVSTIIALLLGEELKSLA